MNLEDTYINKIKKNIMNKNKIIYKIKGSILKLSIKYINWYSKDSNYIKHANNEYQFVWKDYKNDEMQSYMCEQINDILALLSTQGDSGFSINYKLNLLKKLIMFEPLSSLTFENSEFNKTYLGSSQNKRDSRVFKHEDGRFSFNDGFIKQEKYYIGKELKIISKNGGCWNGGCFVLKDNGELYYMKATSYIKNTKTFTGKKFYIPVYSIEFPQDWWISICKESDLKDMLEEYEFEISNEMLEKEIGFKNGIYKDEILKRIELIKEHVII